MSKHVVIASAYGQLNAAEKQYVDDYIDGLTTAARKANERISLALDRPIPPSIVDASGGLLLRPMVLAAITERIARIAATDELTIQRIIDEWSAIAFSNLEDYATVCPISGAPIFDFNGATRKQMSAIASIEYNETSTGGRSIKVNFWSKPDALKAMGTMYGLNTEDNEWLAANRKADRVNPLIDSGENAGEAYAAFIGG